MKCRCLRIFADTIPKSSDAKFLILHDNLLENDSVGWLQVRIGEGDTVLLMFDPSIELGNKGGHHHVEDKFNEIVRGRIVML